MLPLKMVESLERELAERAKRYIKAELRRADLTYARLAQRLTEMGLPETETSIAKKISRGGFSAVFFIAVMKALGRASIDLADL